MYTGLVEPVFPSQVHRGGAHSDDRGLPVRAHLDLGVVHLVSGPLGGLSTAGVQVVLPWVVLVRISLRETLGLGVEVRRHLVDEILLELLVRPEDTLGVVDLRGPVLPERVEDLFDLALLMAVRLESEGNSPTRRASAASSPTTPALLRFDLLDHGDLLRRRHASPPRLVVDRLEEVRALPAGDLLDPV